MICKAAGVGILFFDLPSGLIHQQTVQDIGCLVHRGRDVLCGERAKLVGDMGVSFESWFGTVFRIDEIHRLALPRGGEELPVA